jgi:hypothetical protein
MFTRRISQSDYFGIFTVALGTTWASTHGDLLPRNLPFADHGVLPYLAFMLSKGDDVSSLIPSLSIINLSRCLVHSSLRIIRSQPVHARNASTDRHRGVRDAAPANWIKCSFPRRVPPERRRGI